MTLQQIEYFIHVAKTGNFSQSATDLGISQPSLSRHLQQLETMLGVELLDRYHRPMTLTDAGKFFLQHIEKTVHELHQVIELTKNFHHDSQRNQLTIGFVASVLYGLLPEIISTLKQDLPHLDIKLIEVSSDQQITALKAGEIDVGFGRFLHNDPHIQQIFLRHERFMVALPIHHPLANRDPEEGILLKELTNDTLILYHRTPLPMQSPYQHTDQLLNLFEQHHLRPQRTSKARDIQIALGLVSAGEGITLVPDSLKTVRTEQIHYHRLYHENATSAIYMNMLTHRHHNHLKNLLNATYDVYEQKGITYFKSPLLASL